ncbi:hypothetical protein HKX48_002420 [Thoreauomyces humboldtii]|nr:hypothetical protein HKX48_002420 [Thoreauomyces humboldtii]
MASDQPPPPAALPAQPTQYIYTTAPSPLAKQSSLAWSSLILYTLAALGLVTLLSRLAAQTTTTTASARRRRKRKPQTSVKPRTAGGSPLGGAVIAGQENGKQDDEEEEDAGGILNVVRETSESDSGTETDEDEEEGNRRGWYPQNISDTLTSAMVRSAIVLKRSPVPDLLVSLTGYGLEGYKRVNSAFGVEETLVAASQRAVSAGITATGILAHAAIKAGVAYQVTPGRREAGTVVVERVTDRSLPGGLPRVLCTVGTQTDVSRGAGEPGLLTSYLATSLRVAGSVATTTSTAVLGKDRTLKLLGVDPTERVDTEPDDGELRYLLVGGTRCVTTQETLCAVPGSLLEEYFADPLKRKSLEVREGCYFLDRDGTHFRHILNYLRGLPTHATIVSIPMLNQLLIEARHYRLPELERDLTILIAEMDDGRFTLLELGEMAWRKCAPRGVRFGDVAVVGGVMSAVVGSIGWLLWG